MDVNLANLGSRREAQTVAYEIVVDLTESYGIGRDHTAASVYAWSKVDGEIDRESSCFHRKNRQDLCGLGPNNGCWKKSIQSQPDGSDSRFRHLRIG